MSEQLTFDLFAEPSELEQHDFPCSDSFEDEHIVSKETPAPFPIPTWKIFELPDVREVWHNMKDRCYNPNCPRYRDYGGRGISVCEEWRHNFKAFQYWASMSGYEKGLQIDRINNDGNYRPENCRWVTAAENSRNRRNTIHVTIRGNKMCLKDACLATGVGYGLASNRLKLGGYSPERAAIIPEGFRRPYLCFWRASKGGGCHYSYDAGRRHTKHCPYSSEQEMKQCPNFFDYVEEYNKDNIDRDRIAGTENAVEYTVSLTNGRNGSVITSGKVQDWNAAILWLRAKYKQYDIDISYIHWDTSKVKNGEQLSIVDFGSKTIYGKIVRSIKCKN